MTMGEIKKKVSGVNLKTPKFVFRLEGKTSSEVLPREITILEGLRKVLVHVLTQRVGMFPKRGDIHDIHSARDFTDEISSG